VAASGPAAAQSSRPAGHATRAVSADANILSGGFTWSATFECCLDSRKWTQGGGSTTIKAHANCDGDPGMTQYRIELFKDQWSDKSYGAACYDCYAYEQFTWNNLPSGTYYFWITKRDNGSTITASGSVYYP